MKILFIMSKTQYLTTIAFSILLLTSCEISAASVEKATMYQNHGLLREAKTELIEIIFSKTDDSNKEQAYYLLGNIAFEENRITSALDSWNTLVEIYPNSEQSVEVKDRIDELSEIVGEIASESIENAVASSYLRHGNFWSKDKYEYFVIDSSWIPKVEAAVKWYDKTIKEFPGTTASRVAYQEKLRTLLGWKVSGKYGISYGIEYSFDEYMPLLLDTFNAFESEHPNASNLQAFRYQIAQAYWSNKKWDKTREWLNLIIEVSGVGDSFYKDLAQRRLQKVEY
jgi:tetratricopeptide (TPR) repeat protein